MSFFLQDITQEVAGVETIKFVAYTMVAFRPHFVKADSSCDLRQRNPSIGSFFE